MTEVRECNSELDRLMLNNQRYYGVISLVDRAVADLFDWVVDHGRQNFHQALAEHLTKRLTELQRKNEVDKQGFVVDLVGPSKPYRPWLLSDLEGFLKSREGRVERFNNSRQLAPLVHELIPYRNAVMHARLLPTHAEELVGRCADLLRQLRCSVGDVADSEEALQLLNLTANEIRSLVGLKMPGDRGSCVKTELPKRCAVEQLPEIPRKFRKVIQPEMTLYGTWYPGYRVDEQRLDSNLWRWPEPEQDIRKYVTSHPVTIGAALKMLGGNTSLLSTDSYCGQPLQSPFVLSMLSGENKRLRRTILETWRGGQATPETWEVGYSAFLPHQPAPKGMGRPCWARNRDGLAYLVLWRK